MIYDHECIDYEELMTMFYPGPKGELKRYQKELNAFVMTFQLTERCNFKCSYCYQINKTPKTLKFEYAKKMIDEIFNPNSTLKNYITVDDKKAFCLEFIGGEPFLEVELMDQICEYFINSAIKNDSIFAVNFMISFASNGYLYFEPKVQDFIEKYKGHLSFTISLDGCKEVHDKCRVTVDGKPTYEMAEKAALDWMQRMHSTADTKMTISPENINYLSKGLINLQRLGYTKIHANTVYENVWNNELANTYYYELKKTADYWIQNDLVAAHELTLFIDDGFTEMRDDLNFCGGDGAMLSMDVNGNLLPCIRYASSSLGESQAPYTIGHIDSGIALSQEERERIKCLKCITCSSQSKKECIECPIGSECGWCSAYNYQETGTPNKRVTYICCMHKARALANVYFWNKYYINNNIDKVFPMNCPKEWALEIIDENEYNMLVELTKR